MGELNARNTEAIAQTLKAIGDEVREQQKRIDGLLLTLGNIMSRIEFLERTVMLQKAISTGHGPSVK